MHLVKWLRKNNVKVMAVVFVITLFGFIGGSYISQFSQRRRMGLHKTIAHFADDKKITNYDRKLAQQELEVLRMLHCDVLLKNISVPPFRTPDLRAILLGELLFSERGTSPELISYIKHIIKANGYRISNKQINDIYKRSTSCDIYWLLLKSEAHLAGFRLSNEDSGNLLGKVIPQIFNGATYPQLIGSIVNQKGIPEKQILTTFGKLMAVLEYAKMACSNEDATTRQIMQNVSVENETIDVEFVRFDSAVFAETHSEPTPDELSAHLNKYKRFYSGTISDQNPYGFGYKLPNRVQLEYIAVKLDDVSGIVTPPTYQQAEEYYRKHREQYTEQIASDPNDPNSPLIERTKSYAEVAADISKDLLRNKITSEANRILREADALAEPANSDSERPEHKSSGYKAAAGQLSEKYKINIYTGKTGLLSALDIIRDEQLGTLYLKGYGRNPIGLAQIVFSIDELKASELGQFDIQKPKMYESIGPFEDMSGKITALVRIIRAEKAAEPQSIDQSYSRETIKLDDTAEQTDKNVYSVKEKVAEDLKKLAVMDAVKSKAEDFVKQVVKDGWDEAIRKFNLLYGNNVGQEQSEPNTFKLQSFTNLRRISGETLVTLAVQNSGNPAAYLLDNERKKQSRFINKLYSLVPSDKNALDTVPLIMEFKPEMSFYCLKHVSIKRLDQSQYEKIKAGYAYKEAFIQYQSLAAVHFNPENILKRMNFSRIVKTEERPDTNTPTEEGETL